MKRYLRQMFGLRALALSTLAAYLLMALVLRVAQEMARAPEGSLIEVVIARVDRVP